MITRRLLSASSSLTQKVAANLGLFPENDAGNVILNIYKTFEGIIVQRRL